MRRAEHPWGTKSPNGKAPGLATSRPERLLAAVQQEDAMRARRTLTLELGEGLPWTATAGPGPSTGCAGLPA